MIDKRELRIGNKVGSPKHDLSVATIQGMATNNIVMLEEVKTYDFFSEIEPIPLSDEWLRKFGFTTLDAESDIVVWGMDDNSNGEEFSIITDGLDAPKPIVYYFEYDLGYRDVRKEIKFIHQLQNLYFALTGEELTIRIPK